MASVPGVQSTAGMVVNIGMQLAQLINSFKARPVIGGTVLVPIGSAATFANSLSSDLTGQYAAGGVMIEPTEYRVEYTAEVSEQLLVNVQGNKVFLTDNIAARPRQWRITGYIPGLISTELFGLTATIAGSISPIGAVLKNATGGFMELVSAFMPSLVNKQKYLETLFYGRTTFRFKTRDNEVIQNAVMSELTIERRAESQNKLNISVVVKEINILQAISGNQYTSSSSYAQASSAIDPTSATDLGATTPSAPTSSPPLVSAGHGNLAVSK